MDRGWHGGTVAKVAQYKPTPNNVGTYTDTHMN